MFMLILTDFTSTHDRNTIEIDEKPGELTSDTLTSFDSIKALFIV